MVAAAIFPAIVKTKSLSEALGSPPGANDLEGHYRLPNPAD